jgi:hypothetical protein
VPDISALPQPRTISVEVVLLAERGEVLHYRTRREELDDGVHPDDLALSLAGLTLCTPGALLRSTSWRHEADGLVLTYAALPDPAPEGPSESIVNVDATVASTSPLISSPCSVDLDAVAAHACRHLALLLTTDPVVAEAAAARQRIWELIGKIPAAPEGAWRLSGTLDLWR